MPLPQDLVDLLTQAETDLADLATKTQAKVDADAAVVAATDAATAAGSAKEVAIQKLVGDRSGLLDAINQHYAT